MSAPIVQWICAELSKLLGIDASDDIAKYLLAIESAQELEEYISELLDPSEPRNRKFIDDLLRKRRPTPSENLQVYRKPTEEQHFGGEKKSKKKGRRAQEGREDRDSPDRPDTPDHQVNGDAGLADDDTLCDSGVAGRHTKKKFVPLFNKDGESCTVARLPGRHACDCQASKHPLINNCMQCGRVVCEQEGSGPCLFCRTLVCTREEHEVLLRGSKKSEKLRAKLMGQGGIDMSSLSLPLLTDRMRIGQEKAEKHKEKLLQYDKTMVKRTKVIDDESDYFASDANQWLSQNEKESLRKREDELRSARFASRKDRKVTLDFAGRRVLDAEDTVDMYNAEDEIVEKISQGKNWNSQKSGPKYNPDDFAEDLVNPTINIEAPQFVPAHKLLGTISWPANGHEASDSLKKGLRIQDRELQEMSDDGMCLSLHQPWASLLVLGIKRHEGRSWYTAHRGRLWVAATSKVPTLEEIRDVEQQHLHTSGQESCVFPEQYPSGCLLGCVDVDDCLPQEQYREKFPNGESASAFVFVCTNPHQLILKFPMKGKHKIYKLDPHLHQGAKRGLKNS